MKLSWASLRRFMVLWFLALVLQWGAGAFQSEAGGDPDEPAHLVSGLMVHDYLRAGWGRGPVDFAREYYLHYPKVAIGHWPPMFYAEQSTWTLLFPTSRTSLLIMISLQSALLGLLLWSLLQGRFGPVVAWWGALVLATLPGVMFSASMLMTEIPIAVPILLAVVYWSRFLGTGRPGSAVAFGLWSAVAILTKGTGIVLAGVPLVSVWLAGRSDLLRRAWFWAPVLIVLVFCAPWYLFAPGALHQRVAAQGGLGLATQHLNFPSGVWATEFGWGVAILSSIGLAILLYRRVQGTCLDGVWASVTALVIAASVSPIFFAAWETRHLVEAAPAFVLVAAAGVSWIASALPLRLRKPGLLVVAVLATVSWNLRAMPTQHELGYRELAQAIQSNSFGSVRTILISGNAVAEGSLISELAQRETHPQRYILRGTKVFADIEWMGKVKELRFTNSAQVHEFLISLPVDLAVIDQVDVAPYDYQAQLQQALTEHPEFWRAVEPPVGWERFALYRRIPDGPEISSEQVEVRLKAVLPTLVP